LAPRFVGIFRPVRSLHLIRGGSRRRQIELGRNHQRRPLAILDAPVVHVGAADSGHDALDDLFLEGLFVLVVLGPRGSGTYHEANRQTDDGEPQRATQRSRRIPHHPSAGFGPAHRALPVQIFPGGASIKGASSHPGNQGSARISRDQGAFAAGTPTKESYSRAATPATIATSARLNTYQLKVWPPIWR